MKRPEHIIEDLITRQLDGTPLTDTERRELQEWLEASEANRDAFLRAYKAWGNARLAETRFNTGQALENVMARIAEASRPRSFLRPQLRRLGIGIAAAACVMLAVVGYYRLQPSTVPDIEMFIRQADTPVFTQKEVQLVLSSLLPDATAAKSSFDKSFWLTASALSLLFTKIFCIWITLASSSLTSVSTPFDRELYSFCAIA
jgi:anti-sigma factor RsiW